MNPDELLAKFQSLNIWSSGTKRAPHKPLLALWAIGQCLGGNERLTPYTLVEGDLEKLLRNFGPFRVTYHPEQPFWRMRKDGIWEIDRPELVSETKSGDAHISSVARHNIRGGFTKPVFQALQKDRNLALGLAKELLNSHFPSTLHEEIIRETGIGGGLSEVTPLGDTGAKPEYVDSRRLKREGGFREAVLYAYENQCAVCEFAVQIDGNPLALEAAHIQWHRASGPADTCNGLSLCALHHKLFDKGVFTLIPSELRVIVDEDVSGPGYDESLGRFHEKKLNFIPCKDEHRPAPEFIQWHIREVFKSPHQIIQSA